MRGNWGKRILLLQKLPAQSTQISTFVIWNRPWLSVRFSYATEGVSRPIWRIGIPKTFSPKHVDIDPFDYFVIWNSSCLDGAPLEFAHRT
jgi:hypothetical protein